MTNMSAPSSNIALDKLQSLERVLIRERAEGFTNCKYVVMGAGDEVLLYAKEDSSFLNNVLAGRTRAFQIDLFDTHDEEVIKLRRPYTVGADKMDVCVRGATAAVVRKEMTFFKPVLTINDAHDHPVIRVKGPVSTTAHCDFELFQRDKRRIGAISKRWSGMTRAPADLECFLVSFPGDLDVRYKAALIGTCFLIDILFYEN
ncbi:phospholipid scramblase 3-like [Leptidea sinapis]|uniref:phospholipid scramblase 3-like n=1 Tax=Leptidea sinapis TaxID=189913 RepID=UPI00213CDE3A|nr:phospholipid scramblase 3-like [Leptidea sinapis]